MNTPIQPPDKFAEAKRFLLALSPNGPWTLTAIRPFSAFGGRRTETLFCTSIEQTMEFVAEHDGKLNIHLTANPVKPVKDKPRERDLERLVVAQVDIDKDADGVRLDGRGYRRHEGRMRGSELGSHEDRRDSDPCPSRRQGRVARRSRQQCAAGRCGYSDTRREGRNGVAS
jgi:hypothetical protein